jgi:hypothetical protein
MLLALTVVQDPETTRQVPLPAGYRIYERQKRVKLFLQQFMEVHRVVRRRGSHTYLTIGSQMAVRLSALRAGRPIAPR